LTPPSPAFDGQVVMVKYKDGEKKIVIGSDATINAYVVGDKSEFRPGANIAINAAAKKPDGFAGGEPHQCRTRRRHTRLRRTFA
jgi:hypothetical protein